MKCTKCKLKKDTLSFKNSNKSICFDCEVKMIQKKIAKYSACNMGLNSLNIGLEEFIVVSHYTTRVFKLPKRIVFGLLLVGEAQVYKPDMIYLLKPHEKDENIKYAILERDNYTCYSCGNYGNSNSVAVTDGKLVCVCEKCAN